MEFIREWAFSICTAMVACGIALQIMPKSNLTNIFRLVISVFFLCILLLPLLVKFPLDRIELEEQAGIIAEEKAENLRLVVESQMQAEAQRLAEKNIADKLRQMGINYHSITININTNGQSESVCSAKVVLDKGHEPQRDAIAAKLENALQMDVRLDYA